MFERQRRLLALLQALGGRETSLDFQKLLFLYCFRVEDKPSYDFVPYRFGGFSLMSYHDKRKLVEEGLLEGGAPGWKLTSAGAVAARIAPSVRLRMEQFARETKNLRGDALIAEAYRYQPFYATRSEIAERVLQADQLTLLAVQAARPPVQKPGLVTIGYEGRSIEAFLNDLLRGGVTLLCDVRRNAFSRKFGFSKVTLEKSCNTIGVEYVHLPTLGIPSCQRQGLHMMADYEALFARYERHSLPKQSAALEKIDSWIIARHRVALTCFERKPEQCHRHCIADALALRSGGSLKPQHL